MFKNLRSLAARLTKLVNRFSSAPRRQIKMPVSVYLDLERQTGSSRLDAKSLSVMGLTQDMCKANISFIVPFIRLGDYHLAGHGGEQQRLKLLLELPNGAVRMTVVTKHYQMIEMHSSVQNYLLEAEIININEGDAERYANFLRHGDKAASAENPAPAKLTAHEEKRSLASFLSIF